jgi:hypothetical protein
VKWNLLSTVCVTGLGMVSLWILSSLFTTTDYGIISAALILSTVFSIITDFGISVTHTVDNKFHFTACIVFDFKFIFIVSDIK